MKFILRMLLIRRVEYRIAELPIFGIPLALLLRDPATLRNFTFWEGVFLFLLLFAFGDIVNCLYDRDLDARYKPHLSEAVYGLGVRFVGCQVIAYALAAILISLHLAGALNRWILFPMVLVGVPLAAGYSVPPVRFKARGILHALCLGIVIFIGPMLLVTFLVSPALPIPLLLLILAFAAQQTGIVLVNSAEDFLEDREAGVNTTIVALGLSRGIGLALGLTVTGALSVFALFAAMFLQRPHAGWGWASLALIAMTGSFACFRMGRTWLKIQRQEEAQAALSVKQAAKEVPLWISLTAWSAQIAALALMPLWQKGG